MPGVVVLDHVLKAGEAWLGRPLGARGLKQVKFQSALLPEETAEVSLEIKGDSLAFRVMRADRTIAQGAFVIEATAAAGESVAGKNVGAEPASAPPTSAQPGSIEPVGVAPDIAQRGTGDPVSESAVSKGPAP